jgi:anti-sigma regulatory factor (Ser/Thr protein kinase)
MQATSNSDIQPEVKTGVWRALPAALTSVGEARRLVRNAVSGWQVEGEADDLVLVASELVSNALRHALGVEPGSSSSRDLNDGVWIELVRTAGHVICTVADPSARPPVRQAADPMSGGGQGLALVESLSTCWGWNALEDDGGGKSVWAIVPLGPEAWAAMGAA